MRSRVAMWQVSSSTLRSIGEGLLCACLLRRIYRVGSGLPGCRSIFDIWLVQVCYKVGIGLLCGRFRAAMAVGQAYSSYTASLGAD